MARKPGPRQSSSDTSSSVRISFGDRSGMNAVTLPSFTLELSFKPTTGQLAGICDEPGLVVSTRLVFAIALFVIVRPPGKSFETSRRCNMTDGLEYLS
jgi:hypothetical protein